MNKAKEYLKNSLLFQMSLGSKELFHSNIWAWLMEKEPEFIKVFFKNEALGYTALKIDREYCNRDIIIWLQKNGSKGEQNKGYFVIENKIKTLPSIEQLKKYTVDLGHNKLLGAVFTGLINPFHKDIILPVNNHGNNIAWKFVDYKHIANEIERIAKLSNNFTEFQKNEIFEYCNIVRNIEMVLNSELMQTEQKLTYDYNKKSDCEENFISLKDLRIHDLFIKMKGATFIDYVNKRKINFPQLEDIGFKLNITQSYNHGKATLDFRYSNWISNDKAWLSLGIQIEGEQYRLTADRNKSNISGKSCAEVYQEFERLGWFDSSFNRLNGEIFGKKSSMKCKNGDKYNKYGNKDNSGYSFVYQYYDIIDNNNSYENLYNCIHSDLCKAAEILKNLNKKTV